MTERSPVEGTGERASSWADRIFLGLVIVTAAACLGTIHQIFLRTPNEATMGIVYKILYFHAPSAYGMYLGAAACFAGSVGYLARGGIRWDALARAGADVAIVMGLMVMISGPLWAAKGWGKYWAWDPRLTTSLLSLLIYVAYAILRNFAAGGEAERKFSAALGILGAANLPIIHYSVQKWGGQHPTVVTGKGGGLAHPDMKISLALGFVTFTLLTVVLVWQRMRIHRAQARVDALEQEAVELGLGGD